MKMKLASLALAGVVVLSLGISSVAFAAGGLTGTYGTTITSPVDLKGKWVLRLAGGGAYTVILNGTAVAHGRYSTTATTITFSHETGSGCVGSGTYAWKKSGKIVRFVRKHEHPTCQARAAVFTHRFTQAH